MKVLFISSKRGGKISEIIRNQGESLASGGIEIEYFAIPSGLWNYIKSIPSIRRRYIQGCFNIAHAHYSHSAFASTFAGLQPLVVSLMGTDVYNAGITNILIKLFHKKRWVKTIVKSEAMRDLLNMRKAIVIPNGVNMERFKTFPKPEARKHIGFNSDEKLILFIADPSRPEKNFMLAKEAVDTLDSGNVVLKSVFNIPNAEIPYYLNSADVLLLTSKWEGSVNVVKEAMACNLPVVSTDVGDVKENIKGTKGYYIASFDKDDIALKLKIALESEGRTNGRDRIIELGLDSKNIANRLIKIYHEILAGK